MSVKDRRFSDRYNGSRLKLEISRLNWFGRPKDKHPALISNFAIGGVAIITPLKLKVGQQLQLTLKGEFHNLTQVPAEVVRFDGKDSIYQYGIKFSLGHMPQTASQNVLFILKQMESTLRDSLARVT